VLCYKSTIVPTHVFYAFSAFDMLRYPNLRTADFAKVIPELATIDPHILSRINVDGMSLLPSKPFSFNLSMARQVVTVHICAARKLTSKSSWTTKH